MIKILSGIQYLETKLDLISEIREGSIIVLEERSENNVCYFCNKKIQGNRISLAKERIFDNVPTKTAYYVHQSCYDEAKKPAELVDYKITTPLSMN